MLQRILETHELFVDHAESAETALDYLVEHRPDVIFMDHQMPGMDGLEAVSTIKQNPDTATIPIMMYTSQKGDVYVGQARALGAIGVLPKEVEPVEVSKILESLHIVGDPPEEAAEPNVVVEPAVPAPEPVDDLTSGQYSMLDRLDQDTRYMLEDLFDQQRAIIKRDLRSTSADIAAEVVAALKANDESTAAAPPARPAPAWLGAGAALVAAVVVMATLLVQQNERLRNLSSEYAGLSASLSQEELARVDSETALRDELDAYRVAVDTTRQSTLDAIAWGINRAGQFGFGEEPLGDNRVSDFEELGAHLQAIGFVGQVVVETHVGQHCLSLGANGYAIADPAMPADQCDAFGFDADTALEMSAQQSMSMANLINSAGIRSDGALRYLIVPRGSSDPLVAYPVNPLLVTAGDWNRVADANNRISITLLADPVDR